MIKEYDLVKAYKKAHKLRKHKKETGTNLLVNTPYTKDIHFVCGYDDDVEKDYMIGLRCGHVFTTYKYSALNLSHIVKDMNDFISTYGQI